MTKDVRPWERKSGHHSRNSARVDAEKREAEIWRQENSQPQAVEQREDDFLPDCMGIVNGPGDPKLTI